MKKEENLPNWIKDIIQDGEDREYLRVMIREVNKEANDREYIKLTNKHVLTKQPFTR